MIFQGSAAITAPYFFGSAQYLTDIFATDVSCSGCVGSSDIEDGAVGSGDVAFNYAASTTKGGDATGLTCNNCLNTNEIEDIYVLNTGDTITGQLTINNPGTNALTLDTPMMTACDIIGDMRFVVNLRIAVNPRNAENPSVVKNLCIVIN